MSEYWKSTPKYWCKFCRDYIKDTKFERQQHEATPRHQGNIQRSLKGLHREKANEERAAQRARDEVRRLDGLVAGGAGKKDAESPGSGAGSAVGIAGVSVTTGGKPETPKPTYKKVEERKATLEDRKKQWEQLAAMGIAVPDEARADLALAGEWSVVSERVVGEVGSDGEFKAAVKGVRKRVVNSEEREREEAGEIVTKRKGWGERYKTGGGGGLGGEDEDVEALFKRRKVEAEDGVKKEESPVKGEEVSRSLREIPTEEEAAAAVDVKKEEEEEAPAKPAVVFKKRRKIAK